MVDRDDNNHPGSPIFFAADNKKQKKQKKYLHG